MKVLLKERLFMGKGTFSRTLLAFTIASSFIASANNTQSDTSVALPSPSIVKNSNTRSSHTNTIALTGEVKQGGLIVGKALPSDTVTLNGKVLSVSANGDYVFGFSRDDTTDYQLVVTSINGDRVEKSLSPEKREYKIQRITGIKKSIMNPNPKAIKRSRKDSTQVKAARKTASSLDYFAKGFAPIKGTVTGVYGS